MRRPSSECEALGLLVEHDEDGQPVVALGAHEVADLLVGPGVSLISSIDLNWRQGRSLGTKTRGWLPSKQS